MANEKQINTARRLANMRIEQFYPQHRRENILDLAQGYTEQDRTQFRAFRDFVRARCDEYEAAQDPVIDYSDITP